MEQVADRMISNGFVGTSSQSSVLTVGWERSEGVRQYREFGGMRIL